MRRVKDLTGQKFGKLTVIRPTKERKNRGVVWECKCDCGNTAFVTNGSLVSGNTKSCGCLHMKNIKDLTGQKFGKLTAICPTGEKKGSSVVWECKCDCGNTAFVNRDSLVRGKTKSCGCLKIKDLTGQKFGKLTVICSTKKRKNGGVVWECKCDCGNTAFVNSRNLISGNTQSCGCLYIKDLTGQKFGKLTVIRPTEERKNGGVVWECKCDCGNTAFVNNDSLVSGKTKSCGCYRREKRKNSN